MKTLNSLTSLESSLILNHFTANFNLRAINDLFERSLRHTQDATTHLSLALLTEKLHSQILDFVFEHKDKFDEQFISDLKHIFEPINNDKKETDLGCNLADR